MLEWLRFAPLPRIFYHYFLSINHERQLFTYTKTKNKGSLLFLLGVGVALVSAFFFMNEISYNKAINYLAISHFFMIIGSYVFYLAAKKVISDDTFNKVNLKTVLTLKNQKQNRNNNS